jgi:hypothetical protein
MLVVVVCLWVVKMGEGERREGGVMITLVWLQGAGAGALSSRN